MAFVNWDSSYEIGIPEMDTQHQKWVGIINSFYDNIGTNNIDDKLKQIINEVIDYTHYHFSEEEKLMKAMGYPKLEEQMQMHKSITDKMQGYKQKIDNNEPVLSIMVTNDLKRWLENHIKIEDKKYVEYYKK